VSANFCNSIGRKNTLAAFKAMLRPVADLPYDLRCRLDAANETDALPHQSAIASMSSASSPLACEIDKRPLRPAGFWPVSRTQPAAFHASIVLLGSVRWEASGQPTSRSVLYSDEGQLAIARVSSRHSFLIVKANMLICCCLDASLSGDE